MALRISGTAFEGGSFSGATATGSGSFSGGFSVLAPSAAFVFLSDLAFVFGAVTAAATAASPVGSSRFSI